MYVSRQIRSPNLTIYIKTKEMKLLVNAKDLKTSCYIYVFDTKKVRHNNQRTQLHNNIHTTVYD